MLRNWWVCSPDCKKRRDAKYATYMYVCKLGKHRHVASKNFCCCDRELPRQWRMQTNAHIFYKGSKDELTKRGITGGEFCKFGPHITGNFLFLCLSYVHFRGIAYRYNSESSNSPHYSTPPGLSFWSKHVKQHSP